MKLSFFIGPRTNYISLVDWVNFIEELYECLRFYIGSKVQQRGVDFTSRDFLPSIRMSRTYQYRMIAWPQRVVIVFLGFVLNSICCGGLG